MYPLKKLFFFLLYFCFLSPLPNIAEASPGVEINPPDLLVNPGNINEELIAGESVERSFTLTNDGDEGIDFRIDFEVTSEPDRNQPQRDDPGDIREFELPHNLVSGMTFDGELIWATTWDGHFFSFDPNTYELVDDFDIRGGAVGMIYLPEMEVFWLAVWDTPLIRVLDRNGNNINTFEMPVAGTNGGIAYDGDFIYMNCCWEQSTLFKFDMDLNIVGRIPQFTTYFNEGRGRTYAIEWVEAHENGHLWVTSEWTCSQARLDFDNERLDVVEEFFLINLTGHEGLTHDGENLWTGGSGANSIGYIIDDGIVEPFWITFDVTEGHIDPNEETDITVTLNSEDLINGEYEAEVFITTEDDDEVIVAVILNVIGIPNLDVIWSEEFGYPEVIDWNLAFDNIFSGLNYDIPIELTNNSSDVVIIEEVISNLEFFSVNFNDDDEILEIGESTDLIITFNAPEDRPEEFESSITIISNDQDEREITIPVRAEAQPEPVLQVNPLEIDELFPVGAVEDIPITISNAGEGVLRFSFTHEHLDWPEREEIRGPDRDDPGDILHRYRIPIDNCAGCTGLAWDHINNWIWGIDSFSDLLFAFNPENEEINVSVEVPNLLFSLFFNDGLFWANTRVRNEAVIIQYDMEGNEIARLNSPIDLADATIATDGEHLLINRFNLRVIDVLTLDGFDRIGSIDLRPVIGVEGNLLGSIEWIEDHPDGQLWLFGQGFVKQCFINEDWNCEQVLEFEVEERCYGSTHDGENLLRSRHRTNIIEVIDDGIEEADDWLTYNPAEGEVEPESEIEVTLTINCENLITGRYESMLTISSNDMGAEDQEVVILIEVVSPFQIDVRWPRQFGFPEIIDWNRAFVQLVNGESYEILVEIENGGFQPLTVEDITSAQEYFTVDFEGEFELEVGEQVEVCLTFNAPEENPGIFESTFTIFSNDNENGELEIPVIASTLPPPEIAVDPNAIESIDGGEYEISISNTGGSTLEWYTRMPVRWFSTIPDEGVVEADESEMITLRIDTTGLDAGYYDSELVVLSNDPNNRGYAISISLEVTPLQTNQAPDMPVEFSINAIYPNPFNSVASIQFSLVRTTHVNLVVYSILGMEVVTLIDHEMTAGYHYAEWNSVNPQGISVPSGVYVVNIQAGNVSLKQKVVLTK